VGRICREGRFLSLERKSEWVIEYQITVSSLWLLADNPMGLAAFASLIMSSRHISTVESRRLLVPVRLWLWTCWDCHRQKIETERISWSRSEGKCVLVLYIWVYISDCTFVFSRGKSGLALGGTEYRLMPQIYKNRTHLPKDQVHGTTHYYTSPSHWCTTHEVSKL